MESLFSCMSFFFFFFRGPCLSCVRFNYDLISGALSGGSESHAVTNEAGTVIAGVWLHPPCLSSDHWTEHFINPGNTTPVLTLSSCFFVLQCHMSTHGQRGECWCVNPHTGIQIPSSIRVRGDPNCSQYYGGPELKSTTSMYK